MLAENSTLSSSISVDAKKTTTATPPPRMPYKIHILIKTPTTDIKYYLWQQYTVMRD